MKRYGILSDIHANWEALMAVMEDSQAEGCTDYACLGDVVGYHADPGACVDYIRKLACPVVRGEHDEWAAGNDGIQGLNPLADQALKWTREHLNEDQKRWLADLPLVAEAGCGYRLVHATLDSPGSWAYVANRFDAMASFSHQSSQLCFYGHTHLPCIHLQHENREVENVPGTRVELKTGHKYMVNPGSVGEPRDGDWRAAYAIYDPEGGWVQFRRVEYYLDEARRKVRASGPPHPR